MSHSSNMFSGSFDSNAASIFGGTTSSSTSSAPGSTGASFSAPNSSGEPQGMEQLLPVINKLQDVFSAVGGDAMDLPQIVVVGSQSAGKSSVLENIVGRDFLPRGSGIVTRRPLILQLFNIAKSSRRDGSSREWGEFLHKPNVQFENFDEIRQEIDRETDRLTGKNKGISPQPISLKIYSPHVLNLTLVDLPGIARVPVGDQPKDIEAQIKSMVMTYIEKKNAIILAVSAANQDLATSDALQLARHVDPQGSRTLGVITKIDLMDRGTDAMDMLTGRTFPLRLGYVGVINRGQQDIVARKSIRDALASEEQFFESHPLYHTMASRLGTRFLARTLNKVLLQHIRNCIPELKSRVNKMMQEKHSELLQFGDPMMEQSKGAMLLNAITRFCSDYRNAIDGRSPDVSVDELYGGARIQYIFQDVYSRTLYQIDPTDGLTMNDIRTAIRNATGPKAALFVPESAFEMLVKKQIARLEEPSLQAVDMVYDELQRVVSQLESQELQRFSNLRERVVECVNHLLAKCRSPTKQMIQNLINVELAYINTSHRDFIGGDGAVASIFERMAHMDDSSGGGGNDGWAQAQLQQQQQQQQQQFDAASAAKQSAKAAAQQGGGQFFNMFFNGQQPPGAANPPTNPSASKMTPQQQAAAAQQQAAMQQQQAAAAAAASKVDPRLNAQQHQARRAKERNMESKVFGFADADRAGPVKQTILPAAPASIKAVSTPSNRDSFETELIQSLLVSYFNVVKKNVSDMVPKSIMHFLVNQSKETIQNELVSHLYKEDLFDELLEESDGTAERRRQTKTMVEVLQRANQILNEVRDHMIN